MNTAVLVIDVQQGLFDPARPPAEAREVIDRINRLTARARAAGAPVAMIVHESPSGALAHGSPGWQLADGLVSHPADRLVRKTTPDSFLRTELAAWLAEQGATSLVICGYASEFCVDTTTRSAAGRGFHITLAADAHTTHDKDHADGGSIRAHHNYVLSNMKSFGVRIEAVAADDIAF